LYWREGDWKDGEAFALQRIFVSPNYQKIHDSRYPFPQLVGLIIGGDFTAGNGTGTIVFGTLIIAQVENPFMARNSKMRISNSSMRLPSS
jgi:hypothetical protein